jgi:hypothetical protein
VIARERVTHGELGGFDAMDSFPFLTVIGFGPQQDIDELGVADFIASGIGESFV